MSALASQRYATVLSGPQAIAEGHKMAAAKLRDKQERWPYTWFAPPPGSEHVRADSDGLGHSGAIPAPPNGVLTLVASYQVPNGQKFCFTHILLGADVGGAWVPGDGSIIFSVDVNRPGAGNAQGLWFKDFQRVLVPLGSFANGPWPVIATEQAIFEALSTIRIKVVTTATINPGAPNFIHGMILGYTFPD